MLVPETLQPFFDYYFGFRRGTDAGQPPDQAGPRAEFPGHTTGFPVKPMIRQICYRVAANRWTCGCRRPGRSSRCRHRSAAPEHCVPVHVDHRLLHQSHRDLPGDNVEVAGVIVDVSTASTRGHPNQNDADDRPRCTDPRPSQSRNRCQNLVAARYVELTPAYESGGGTTMSDGGVISLDRTAIPWNGIRSKTS